MRHFLFKFLGFLAALEGVRRLEIETILFGGAVALAVIACAHFLTAPLNPDLEAGPAVDPAGEKTA